MSLLPFHPETALDNLLLQARNGQKSIPDVLNCLARENLYVSSKEEVAPDGAGFSPLLLEGDDGPLVAAFSALPHAKLHKDAAQHALQMNGKAFIARMPPDYGVVLNPGYDVQLIIPASAVAKIKQDMR